jgi:hypothetical protein
MDILIEAYDITPRCEAGSAKAKDAGMTVRHDLTQPIHYERQPGYVPPDATLADALVTENKQLRQLLRTVWQTMQSQGAYMIQQGQGLERLAVSVARELQ